MLAKGLRQYWSAWGKGSAEARLKLLTTWTVGLERGENFLQLVRDLALPLGSGLGNRIPDGHRKLRNRTQSAADIHESPHACQVRVSLSRNRCLNDSTNDTSFIA
jgi:hypothetical protein